MNYAYLYTFAGLLTRSEIMQAGVLFLVEISIRKYRTFVIVLTMSNTDLLHFIIRVRTRLQHDALVLQ